jgi:hypothetical protein
LCVQWRNWQIMQWIVAEQHYLADKHYTRCGPYLARA